MHPRLVASLTQVSSEGVQMVLQHYVYATNARARLVLQLESYFQETPNGRHASLGLVALELLVHSSLSCWEAEVWGHAHFASSCWHSHHPR